jgi:hypothetical protein
MDIYILYKIWSQSFGMLQRPIPTVLYVCVCDYSVIVDIFLGWYLAYWCENLAIEIVFGWRVKSEWSGVAIILHATETS